MIERIIDWCTSNRFLVFTGTTVLTLWGLWSMTVTPLDAVPDISDVQVIVSTEWIGRSPDLIEDQITYPLVSALISTPRVRTVRGFTDFGISYVYVIFEDGTDMYWARSRVVEYLQGIRGQLPDGVNPVIGPDATGVGWVFEYALVDETGQHDLAELRGFQDWHLRYWLASVPGVAEVASIGGFVKQYQVNLDPNKLAAYDLAVGDVVRVIKASNNDVEGRLLEFAGREYMVRGRGYLTSADDIAEVSLGADARGTPIRVADVAQVRLGPDLRRGVAELDGQGEVVGGIVIVRYGENALGVINRVKAKLLEVKDSLPPGVEVVPTYDRSGLIEASIGTLSRTLIEEAVVVSLVIIIFLFHVRSALIPILTLPIAVVAAFIPMYYLGVSSNIMSLGGIALAIGVLVDASIVMVENAYRHVSEADVPYEDQPRVILAAARQVGRPIFFSLAIIIVSFVPVFLLEAQEGRMFRPLAFTKTFAMAFASVLSITLVPVLMTVFIRGRRLRPESANPLARFCAWVYAPVLRLALGWRWTALVVNLAVVPLTLPLLFTIGSEFMPPLYEGSMLYMPTAPPGLAVGEATRLLQVQDKLLRQFPEVERVFGTVGRATTSTDNSPMGMVNTTITLKPKDEWRPGLTIEALQSEMDAALQFPG
ncbi:MAG: CusA/CzcA family heavy metal efflux RND transporter, partial [Vicinamibacterales bacterium]